MQNDVSSYNTNLRGGGFATEFNRFKLFEEMITHIRPPETLNMFYSPGNRKCTATQLEGNQRERERKPAEERRSRRAKRKTKRRRADDAAPRQRES